jgi:hypothetical protein
MRGQDKSPQPRFHRSIFTADFLGAAAVPGWTDGSDWNGWATPYFEFAEAKNLIRLHQAVNGPDSAYYNPQSDTFGFLLNGGDEPELFGAVEIAASSHKVKVYPIGTCAWIWEEVDPEDADTASSQ